ncbi:MAG: response regulator [Bacilli bacterium]|nr:response regulator [Bacilli bacterium]
MIDDEMNILRNLQSVIPWEQIGIEVAGLAQNGVAGLERAKEIIPDIILCDIRMPVMDGIEFLAHLRQINEHCEVIMLTGYQEFEYARAVIKYGVKEYILKPIDYEELEQTISRLAADIRRKNFEKRMREKKWNKVMDLAYEKILYDVLMNYPVNMNLLDFKEDVQIEDLAYYLLLIDMDEYTQKSRQWSDSERKLWNFAVCNVLQEALKEEGLHYAVLQMREGEWCFLIEQHKVAAEYELAQVKDWSNSLQGAVKRNVKLEMSIVINPSRVPIFELSDIYKQMQRSLHLASNKREAIIISKDNTEKTDTPDSLWNLIEEMVSGLKQSDRVKTQKAQAALSAILVAVSVQSFVRVQQILHFLVLHLVREMREMDIVTNAAEEMIWNRMEQSVDVKDLLDVIHQIVDIALQNVLSKKSGDIMMLSAADYVQKNLSSDISIDELADYLSISCSYFSLLFKQHFGETFLEYVTRERMELAKSMLRTSLKSVNQIGKLVGFPERRYFTKVFLKHIGSTPSEYREQHITEQRNGNFEN